jgi:hypothetical protein
VASFFVRVHNQRIRSRSLPACRGERIVSSANYGGHLHEEIVEIVQPSLKEQIAALIREINAQNNRASASPYYFVVQSKKWVDTVHDGNKQVIYDEGIFTLEAV